MLSEPKVPETPEDAALKASVQAQTGATIQSVNTRPSRRRKRGSSGADLVHHPIDGGRRSHRRPASARPISSGFIGLLLDSS